MTDFETMLRLRRIETQTGLLQSMTHLKDGPQKAILRGLVEGGATSVLHLVAPDGHGFGVGATGDGERFATAVVVALEALLDSRAAARFRAIATAGEHRSLRFEMYLGLDSWIAAGCSKLRRDEAVAVLRLAGLTAPPDVVGEGPFSALVCAKPPKTLAWALVPSEGPELVVEGDAPSRVRRPGKPNLELVDWLGAQGLGGDYARRLGMVHAEFEASAPASISQRVDSPAEQVVLIYAQDLT